MKYLTLLRGYDIDKDCEIKYELDWDIIHENPDQYFLFWASGDFEIYFKRLSKTKLRSEIQQSDTRRQYVRINGYTQSDTITREEFDDANVNGRMNANHFINTGVYIVYNYTTLENFMSHLGIHSDRKNVFKKEQEESILKDINTDKKTKKYLLRELENDLLKLDKIEEEEHRKKLQSFDNKLRRCYEWHIIENNGNETILTCEDDNYFYSFAMRTS